MLVALALLGLGRVANAGSHLGLVADEDEGPRLLVRPARCEGRRPRKVKHYYVRESVGIAVGILLAALTHAGLATLTHTPSPMGFLAEILDRPRNERPYVVIPVGYPAKGATVPAINRKSVAEILIEIPSPPADAGR